VSHRIRAGHRASRLPAASLEDDELDAAFTAACARLAAQPKPKRATL
jgi:hypothetical protein